MQYMCLIRIVSYSYHYWHYWTAICSFFLFFWLVLCTTCTVLIFFPRDAMLARVLAMALRLSVSQVNVLSKGMNGLICFLS